MTIGVCGKVLNRKQRSVLMIAAKELIGTIVSDMEAIRSGKEFINTNMPNYLPLQFRHQYNVPFMKKLLDTAIVLRWKIQDARHWLPSNMAEEMLLSAMLERAEAYAELKDIEFDSHELEDLLLDDRDFALLFDPSMDGIEYCTDLLAHLGIIGLYPENWFESYEDSYLLCQ